MNRRRNVQDFGHVLSISLDRNRGSFAVADNFVSMAVVAEHVYYGSLVVSLAALLYRNENHDSFALFQY